NLYQFKEMIRYTIP
nr:RecName: Full=Basic phospholipase A2 T1-2 A chain; Short=svPLA2; AltName: Full=Phosphatidylcholine 2-acylhydrolase T1-2 A [Bungarus candidus]P84475.1 RecName: Full=Basic phospholipase A2 T1-1 A chain; Short=svPLA2; AltName: Full=Phosphatidylcholine 2-acylhydrolase T1-1 A [Bungarus candidus]